MLKVKPIDKKRTHEYILNFHYARRLPQIKYAFGLFDDVDLVGICTYSIPASYTLCKGVCGEQHKKRVLELSRLVIVARIKNAASILIAGSLRQLPSSIVVSYADDSHAGHVGYVYQATNWIYTGRGNAEPAWALPDGTVISRTRRHIDKKAKRYGLEWTDLIKIPQNGKHRYVTFTGSKRDRRIFKRDLRYPQLEYPKGNSRRHEFETKEALF